MRRIIHNTTALAACLSLLAPQLATAQPTLPARWGGDLSPRPLLLAQAETPAADPLLQPQTDTQTETPEADAQPAQEDPDAEAAVSDLEAALAAEEAASESESEGDGNAAGDAAPDDAKAVEADPATEAEDASAATEEGGADPVDEPAAANGETAPEAEAEAAPQAEVETETEVEAASEEAAPETATPAKAPEAGQDGAAVEAPLAAQSKAEPEAASAEPAADDVAATPDASAAPQAQADTQAPTAGAGQAEPEQELQSLEEALGGAMEQNAPDAVEAQAQTDATAQASSNGSVSLARGDTQQTRAGEMPGLANVLNEEVSGGLTAESLTCLSGGSFPCADGGRAMTPRGVVVEPNGAGELRLAPVEAQMNRVTRSGEIVQRAAEEDTQETEASREAAEAATPANAAALEAEEGSGEVTEQQITEENTRSSSEDFATNLRDALAGATGQTQQAQENTGGSDNNNLSRALLLGLGAVAVGSYLNNNRQVALSTPDRVVVTRPDGSQEIIKDEVALLRQPGSTVTTENFDDGSSRTIVTRQDGSRVVTIRDANLQVLRRTLVSADGTTTRLIDESVDVQPVDLAQLPEPAPVQSSTTALDEDALRAALQREADVDRRFTLSQIRNIPEVRALVAPVNIDAITFDTGSAAIRPDQAQGLQSLGRVIQDAIARNPQEIFMIEGHTDTVGADAYNLALSDRRAESVALALTEYFDVPPENMVTQGYGERFLRVRSEGDIRENRRASVRRITDLLAQ